MSKVSLTAASSHPPEAILRSLLNAMTRSRRGHTLTVFSIWTDAELAALIMDSEPETARGCRMCGEF